MLKKTKFSNTLFKTIIHFGERQRPLYSNFIISRTEANQNVHGTDIEQRKELKNKTRINKEPNFTTELLNNACNWTLLSCAIEQHGGDLLNITNENSRYKGGNC
jgi:hypothetical protein